MGPIWDRQDPTNLAIWVDSPVTVQTDKYMDIIDTCAYHSKIRQTKNIHVALSLMWWHYGMNTLSSLLALYADNQPIAIYQHKEPTTQIFWGFLVSLEQDYVTGSGETI